MHLRRLLAMVAAVGVLLSSGCCGTMRDRWCNRPKIRPAARPCCAPACAPACAPCCDPGMPGLH